MVTKDWQRLGQRVRNRRMQLGYTRQADLQAAGGPSERTISSLETGNPVKDWQLDKLDLALRWKPGGCRQILIGGEPEEDDAPRNAPTTQSADQRNIERMINASAAELVRMFREEVEARPGMTRARADQWLVDVLEMRAHALRLEEAAKRSAS